NRDLTNLTVEYAGTAAQVINGITYGNLAINNASGATLSGNATVAGTLTFTSGKINTSTFTLTTTSGNITGASQATGWVNGKLQRSFSSGVLTGTFPIGGATYYSPLTLTFGSITTGGTITASTTDGAHPNISGSNILAAKNIPQYWSLTNTGIVFSNYSVGLDWNVAQNYAGLNATLLKAGRYSASAWTQPTISGTPTTTHIDATGNTAVGDFIVGEPCSVSASISYTSSPYCSSSASATVTHSGTTGGTYSSTAGLSINASTGEINPSASTPGTYTVTYTIAAAGGCTAFSTTASVTITAAPSATISYTATPYCSGTAAVTLTGTSGGTYSSTAGLSITSATGAINLAASTPGTYTVTYTVAAANGCGVYTTTTTFQNLAIANNGINYTNGTSGVLCATPNEGGAATLTAPAGTHFVEVDFASYGTPSGSCSAFAIGTCHASTSQAVAQTYLLGNNAATVPATNAVFTDPCVGTGKRLYVQASYAQPICAGTTPSTLVGSTPTGGNGTYTYLWESSTTSATSGFTTVSGTSNAKDYSPGALSQTTWFRRTVTSGGCSGTSPVVQVTVTTPTTAAISYTGSPYCSSSGTAAVTQTGATGGTYSGTTGLVINSTTGAVTLGTSTAGTHTVTYTVPATGGCPAFSTTASIVITAQPVATGGYANSTYCTNGGSAVPNGSSNAVGTLSASPSGIWIDANFTNYGIINLGASSPGTYTVTYTVPAGGGCAQYTNSWPITIVAAPTSSISYAGSPYCSGVGTATVTQTGTSGGSFTSASGLSINASTGAIDLGASTPGAYTVTYTIPAANGCAQVTSTASVTITPTPSATISYTGSPYCSSSGTASATLTGTAGGTYSGTSGLVINASTGAVTLGTSTAGTHTVTYTIPAAGGCAVFSTTATLTITTQPNAAGSYPGTVFCTNGGLITPSGTTNSTGIFTSSPAGIYQDAWFTTYGVINLGASAPGTYLISYMVPAGGGCPQYDVSGYLTINAAPTGTISYTGSPYCSASGTATVTQTGTTGGTFSSAGGLSLNASTGAVNLGASTPGTYTVTYTVTANGCTHTTTGNITITQSLATSVSIASSASTICTGGNATFTATPVNGGSTPAYQWKVNGANVGTNSATYSSTALASGDVVTCVMTSNATCPTGSPATSNAVAMTVTPNATVTNAATANACSSIPTAIALTSTTPSSYAWTIGTITGGITGASAGAGPTINQTLVNPGSTAGTVQYVVTPTATSVAHSGTMTVGNQAYADRLGLIFTVNSPITVTSLGVFDDGQNGLVGTLQVGIVRNSDGVTMAGPISMTGTADPLDANFRMRAITPVTLPVGTYTIVSVGHSASERNGNTNIGGTGTTVNTGAGAITYNSSS
ncbi:MAG TPA: hypothetical protein VGB67_02585, partial [Fibrella sp.]